MDGQLDGERHVCIVMVIPANVVLKLLESMDPRRTLRPSAEQRVNIVSQAQALTQPNPFASAARTWIDGL
jgi:hypothetical protein